jgi:hypothetical protein
MHYPEEKEEMANVCFFDKESVQMVRMNLQGEKC